MSRIKGIQCDWCGKIADLVDDQATAPHWGRLHLLCEPTLIREADLCVDCVQTAVHALDKTKKQRATGKTQR